MDFFEAQARARKRSARLVLLFACALGGLVVAGYAGAWFAQGFLRGEFQERRPRARAYQVEHDSRHAARPWFDPTLLGYVAAGTLAVVGLASLYKWSELRAGGAKIAEMVGGTRIHPHTTDPNERRLLNVVEEMAIASGVPMPGVYLLADEPAINAFAAGLTPSDAVIAVTRGTLDRLSRDELQAVVGHEFSHILNGDMRLNVRLTAILFGILVLGLLGRGILQSLRHARFSSRNGKNSGGVIVALAIVGLLLMVLGYIGYFFGRMIQAAVSRQREFLADASAVQFTRNPVGLTGALKKIGGLALGSKLQSAKCGEIGHFFFSQGVSSFFGSLWATHPPLATRIRAVDASFDGTFVEPPTVVDVATRSWSQLTPPPVAAAAPAATLPTDTVLASVGTLAPEHLANATAILDQIPAPLRDAVHEPEGAMVVCCALLLAETTVAAQQLALVRAALGADTATAVSATATSTRALAPTNRLPLVQLALPSLGDVPTTRRDAFIHLLDDLISADHTMTAFEFALQKTLIRHLRLRQRPTAYGEQIQSFHAVADDIALVLSMLARAAADAESAVSAAFTAGAGQLKLLDGKLALQASARCSFLSLDHALDRLAKAALPIKKRVLAAAAHTAGADGVIRSAELDLLRAFASALDCPMPSLQA